MTEGTGGSRFSGCRKSRWLFSTACNNAGIFVPRSGTEILASLHARLAEQGLARHLIRFEAGSAPSSSPCEEERLHARQGVSTRREPAGAGSFLKPRRMAGLCFVLPHGGVTFVNSGRKKEAGRLPFFESIRYGGDHSLSSLRTAMKASVGTWTVPRLRIFFLPSFCFSSSFFLRVMSPP